MLIMVEETEGHSDVQELSNKVRSYFRIIVFLRVEPHMCCQEYCA